MLVVRENEIALRKMLWCYCAIAHLRGNTVAGVFVFLEEDANSVHASCSAGVFLMRHSKAPSPLSLLDWISAKYKGYRSGTGNIFKPDKASCGL